MKKTFQILLLIIAIALLPINSAWAEDKPPLPNQNSDDLQPGQEMRLHPEEGSEVILDFVSIKVLPDGAVTISASGKYWANAPRIAYDIAVDTTRSTYKTSMVSPDEIEVDSPQIGTLVTNPKLANPNFGVQSINPGIYSAQVKVQSLDPVYIKVAETTNFLRWQVYSNGTLGWISYLDGCWAANPTPPPLNTHWSTTYCSSTAPWYSNGNTVLTNDSSGQYQNWDWHNPSLSTGSAGYSTLKGYQDGSYYYTWSYNDWDEDAILLWGRAVLN